MNEHKYFLDSNIFLRPVVKDNVKHVKECEVLFGRIKKEELRIFTSNLVLAEIVWVLKSFYGLSRQTIAKIMGKILAISRIKIIDDFDSYLAAQFYQQHSIKFIDALIASNPDIQNKEMVVVSYDDDFDKLDVIRKEPGDVK